MAPVYLYSDNNNREEFIEDENDTTGGDISGGMNNGLPPPQRGGGKVVTTPVLAPNEVIIGPSFSRNPCLPAVYNKMGGSKIFNKYLKEFDKEMSVANLTLKTSSGMGTVNAKTSPPSNYMINITFNTDNLNRPCTK